MKKQIPLEVSSTLGTIATDKPLEITPYANATGVTTEKAPVLIAVRSEGTVDADQFAARMPVAGGQGTAAQARLAINAIAAVLNDIVGEYGAITVNTPFGTVQTFVAGTLENANDAPDPDVNCAFLGVVVPEAYRRQFAQMTAYVPASACPAALKRVRDKATNAKGIVGTEPFYLEGVGMTIGGDGETLELLDAVTRDKLCDVAVDPETKSTVQFQCQLVPEAAIAAGTYLLRLTTLAGGEPGAALWPVELKVELLEAVTPSKVPFTFCESDGSAMTSILSADYKAFLRSDEHEFAEGETLTLTNLDADGNVRRSEECPVVFEEGYDYPYVENPFTDGYEWHGGTVRGENDQVVGTVPWQE